jgi:hypothetical protein
MEPKGSLQCLQGTAIGQRKLLVYKMLKHDTYCIVQELTNGTVLSSSPIVVLM